ncbi:MAG TPA: 16S rRNA (cytosine(967)-C(5))-methyltransferase RsmB [Xanthomonadales bacterium]|nr:16S rRNA (cytosine(967)-C(5))-methyltransferase RsmB [Xanthomonadales bacterium]
MKHGRVDNARLAALALLSRVLDQGLSLADTGGEAEPADPRDRAFSRHLAYGVLRWLGALEWLTGQLLQRPLRGRDRDIQRLIFIGLHELWQNASGAHAAINESAECARMLQKPWAVGLINAVLRRFQREGGEWLDRLAERDEQYAHPAWLLDALRHDWPDDWRSIVDANNQAAPLWLRVRCDRDTGGLLEQFAQAGFSCETHPQVAGAWKIHPAAAVTALPGFNDGLVSVQDPAAQLAAELLQPDRADRVLDACAAPGGKAAHLLERFPGITLTALDRSAQRLELVAGNLRRLGLDQESRLALLAADATEPDAWWDGQAYQRILLDAPCTATGVIRRHPEIKWLRSPAQVEEAARLQHLLLERLWPLLDAGGILLYATCSVLGDENSRQIEDFLAGHPDAELIDIAAEWGRRTGTGRQILPGERDMDGFFYARLRKA